MTRIYLLEIAFMIPSTTFAFTSLGAEVNTALLVLAKAAWISKDVKLSPFSVAAMCQYPMFWNTVEVMVSAITMAPIYAALMNPTASGTRFGATFAGATE